MRVAFLCAAGLAGFGATQPAAAATIVVLTNPETLQRKTIIVDRQGPDRIFMCMLPPGEAGCHQVPVKRRA
jgi:hypothetical protein